MRRRRHPSRDDLKAWLEGTNPSIDDHVGTCNRCATALEELDAPPIAHLADALAEVYEPPADLSERLTQRVSDRLDSQIMLNVVADLFGAGMETTKLLLTEEPPDE